MLKCSKTLNCAHAVEIIEYNTTQHNSSTFRQRKSIIHNVLHIHIYTFTYTHCDVKYSKQ